MRVDPRPVAALAALAALGVATWADWWRVEWSEGLAGAGTLGIPGTAGTGGLAALLPAVVLAALLATLTLQRTGRRVVGVVSLLAALGMAALGFWAPVPSDAVVEQRVAAAALGGDRTVAATGSAAGYGAGGLAAAVASAWLVAKPPARRARGVRSVSGDVTDPLASWKAMDDGQDPTDEGERP